VGLASSLGLLQKEVNGSELADSSADGSPKWRKPVGHDIQAKVEYTPFQYITSYWYRVRSMWMKGIRKQAQWPGKAR
jgi:hypothetical protein